MYYSLRESPLVSDTAFGIRIATFTSNFMGDQTPGIQFVSIVCLPCPTQDAIETCRYRTESEARHGHAQLVQTYACWSQGKVQSEILKRQLR
jgi:hypothetical protein